MSRRHRPDDSGLISLVLDAAKASPLFGLIAGTLFCLGGAYLIWINPRAIMGLGQLAGFAAGMLGLLCLAVAGMQYLRRSFESRSAASRLDRVWTLEAVRALSWQQFESLVADLFRREGYQVEERGRAAELSGSGDGGVDLVLTDPRAPGAHFLVQCKQYRAWDVGEPRVREFYGAMAAFRTRCEGIMVTCGRYTQPAKEFAADKPIRLIDGDGLLRMLNAKNATTPTVSIKAPDSVQAASIAATNASEASPRCPNCGAPMARRQASRGPRAGKPFWGCTAYPKCKGIVNISD